MTLASWLLLLNTVENTGILFPQNLLLSPHCYADLKGTLNCYEPKHLMKIHLHYITPTTVRGYLFNDQLE